MAFLSLVGKWSEKSNNRHLTVAAGGQACPKRRFPFAGKRSKSQSSASGVNIKPAFVQ